MSVDLLHSLCRAAADNCAQVKQIQGIVPRHAPAEYGGRRVDWKIIKIIDR